MAIDDMLFMGLKPWKLGKLPWGKQTDAENPCKRTVSRLEHDLQFTGGQVEKRAMNDEWDTLGYSWFMLPHVSGACKTPLLVDDLTFNWDLSVIY